MFVGEKSWSCNQDQPNTFPKNIGLILKGRGLCLYRILDNLYELPTSIELLFYVIYGIVL